MSDGTTAARAAPARPPTGREQREGVRLTTALCRFVEARAIADGYELAYPSTPGWRAQVAEIVAHFEQRLPLFRAAIAEDPAGERIWLRLTGPPQAQAFVADLVAWGKSDDMVRFRRSQLSLHGRLATRAALVLRRATSALRVLPDFLIIGAAKCGTTSLYGALTMHPSIVAAGRKEIYFFDHAHEKGLGYYRAFFPTVLQKRRVDARSGNGFRTGEATPCYLFHPHAPRRVAAHVPGARLIALLRNPVDRAYSDYCMKLRLGHEELSFEQAIDAEPARVDGELAKMAADEGYFGAHRWHFSYLGRGAYAEQLERWLAHFPRAQLLVLSSEEMFVDPGAAYGRIMDHLGLPAWQPAATAKSNYVPYPAMAARTRARLVEHFAPLNRRLYEMLGRSFDWER